MEGQYTHTEEWSRLEILDYVAGMIDGDASVHGSSDLKFALSQTQKAKNVILFIQSVFGGRVSSRKRNEKWDLQYELTITGKKAIKLCAEVHAHCHIKHRQLFLASQWGDVHSLAVEVMDAQGNCSSFASAKECARNFGLSADLVAAYLRGSKALPCCLRACTVRYSGAPIAEAVALRKSIILELHHLKRIPHAPITKHLSVAYLSGFFDAEGCLMLHSKNCISLTIKQKYEAICRALVNSYGGSFHQCPGEAAVWKKTKGAKTLLQLMYPFLIGKRQQASLVLTMKPEDYEEVKEQLCGLKGLQKGGSAANRRQFGLPAIAKI